MELTILFVLAIVIFSSVLIVGKLETKIVYKLKEKKDEENSINRTGFCDGRIC